MELLNYSPLKSVKLQFVGWVMDLSLGKVPASTGDDGISPVTMGLVEDSARPDPPSIGVQLEGPGKVSIGQNRHCGT